MVIAMRSRLLCIAALVTSLGTMCFADTLRVMSFNVRYPAKGDGKDRWEVRQDILARTIRLKNPDLIGTQELFYIQGEFIVQNLPEYEWFGNSRRAAEPRVAASIGSGSPDRSPCCNTRPSRTTRMDGIPRTTFR
jgi:hypothetical protein